MITTIVSAVSLVFAIVALIFTIGARNAAKAAVADTMRLSDMMDERYSLVAGNHGDDWAALDGNGKLLSSGTDLRTVMDAARDELETRAHG